MGIWNRLFGGPSLRLREPRFAQALYPSEPGELRRAIDALVGAAQVERGAGRPRALIVPHAPLKAAGGLMATGWAACGPLAGRVAVVGSSRLVPFRGVALDAWEGVTTPLGALPYPRGEYWESAPEGCTLRRMAAAFDPDESLEVHWPFLRRLADEAAEPVEVVAALVGDAAVAEVVEVLAWLAAEASLLVVVANLSEDVAAPRGRQLDAQCEQAILSGRPEEIGRAHSRSRVALRALLRLAARRGWTAQRLARGDSHSAGGPAASVVGWGAFALTD